MQKTKIVLASASIGRRGLLEKLGVPFEVIKSTVDEEKINDSDPYLRIQKRARAKAEDVVKIIQSTNNPINTNQQIIKETSRLVLTPRSKNNQQPTTNNSQLIIAADSEALLNGKTYGKSKDKKHAKEIVRALMGNTHEFLTATTIILSNLDDLGNLTETKRWENITKTLVTMKTMTETEIKEYTSRYDFTKFAAAYTLNETPWDLITKIEGSYTNVIGLPFEALLPILRNLETI